MGVVEPSTDVTTAPDTQQVATDNTMIVIGTGIGIIVAIAIVGALMMMAIRKK